MLDAKTIAIVKSTLPLLTQTGPALTTHFYQRMFSHHPELKDIFNMSNRRNGDQREALFNAICAYAANIDNLSALFPAVERIAQKHANFSIQPAQYRVVGEHFIGLSHHSSHSHLCGRGANPLAQHAARVKRPGACR